MEMVNIKVNGVGYEVPANSTILEAARTAGIDIPTLCYLKDINQKLGVTIIIITHELAVVRSICNRMVVIDNGLFVEQGETAEIFENPQSEVARLLLGKEEV